jgi:hypothetical protein
MYKIKSELLKKIIVIENSLIALIDSIDWFVVPTCYCMSGHWECSLLIWNQNPNYQNSKDVGKSHMDSQKI